MKCRKSQCMYYDNEMTDNCCRLLREEVKRLRSAISWALGEGDSDFGMHKPKDATIYWWRKELRQRAESV